MAGLAGADQGSAGFGNDPHGRESRILKDLSVSLPLGPVPAGRTPDIKTAVFTFNEAAGHIQFSQDAAREAPDIPGAGRIREETALKAEPALCGIRCIAGLLADQKFSGAQPGIGRDKAARFADRDNLRLHLLVLFQICDRAFRVTKVKPVITIHSDTSSKRKK